MVVLSEFFHPVPDHFRAQKIRLSFWQGRRFGTFDLRHLVDPGNFMVEFELKTLLVSAGTTLASSH